MTTIAEVLEEMPVSELDLQRFVSVPVAATTAEAVQTMNGAGVSCALVVDDGILAGIFTQRDILLGVLGHDDACRRPVTELMTAGLRTMSDTQSVADGLHIMNELWVRSVPVLDAEGKIVGNLSYYVLMTLIADLLSQHALRTPQEVSVQHGMQFVDFTGLNYSQPVAIEATNTVADAMYQMQSRSIGSLFVVDDREHVIGVLTEYDLQRKVACQPVDVETLLVREVMTPEPIAISVRSPIGDAMSEMAEHGFSHIPLLGESGRLVGVTSFRDIADYFETSLGVLG